LGAKVAVADLNLRSYEEFEAGANDMTADSTVAEIEGTGGIALGIEVDVRDQEAKAMVARSYGPGPDKSQAPSLHSECKPSVCAIPCKKSGVGNQADANS
jgi:hypothetical protein